MLVLITTLYMLLIGIIVVLGLFFLKLKHDYEVLTVQADEYQEETASSQETIDQLQLQIEEQQIQLEEQSAQIEELNERAVTAQAEDAAQTETGAEVQEEGQAQEEGMLSPGSGDSVFSAQTLSVGEIVDAEALTHLDDYFQAYTIERDGDVFQRINGKSYQDNDNISLEQLRYLRLLHYNYQHELQVGEMIVNQAIQEDVLNIFKELLNNEYEVESIRLVDDYWVEGGDGDAADFESISKNNTSCFNYRVVTGGASLSNHAYGCAIDLNPLQNPYLSYAGADSSHPESIPYQDRSCGDPHVIVNGDTCYQIFEKYGFSWGGNWSAPIDYQHFEKVVY